LPWNVREIGKTAEQYMIIRKATLDDRTAMLRLLRQIAFCSNDSQYGPDTSDEKLFELLEKCNTFVLEHDSRLIGMNAVQIVDLSQYPQSSYRRMAFIMAFGIEEGERRRGCGTVLFEHVRDWLSVEMVDLLSLNVSASNKATQAFYQRMGLTARSVQMEQVV
jgi:ribosomal protein S18 acetylase RimI-like enzyme